jgi:hypothetical protein
MIYVKLSLILFDLPLFFKNFYKHAVLTYYFGKYATMSHDCLMDISNALLDESNDVKLIVTYDKYGKLIDWGLEFESIEDKVAFELRWS